MKKIKLAIAFFITALSFQAFADNNLTIASVPDFSPVAEGQHVVINIPQQRLFLYTDGKLTKIYPVAVGKAKTQTNLGEHTIGVKAFNPTWHIPKSIQKELNNGVTSIPPGPDNPLGPVFVRLGDPKLGLGIHGTNAPASVPGVRSHGCVRMKSPDALEFAKTIHSGSPASVIYQMANLNVDENYNLWIAAFKDPYSKNNLNVAALKKSINTWAKDNKKTFNAKRLDAVLKNKSGMLNCLTCASGIKQKGALRSIAWNDGSSEYTRPKVITKEEVKSEEAIADLPNGAAIEVNEDPNPSKGENLDQSQPVDSDNLF